MSKRTFTPEEIATLLQNKHVAACSKKSITYHQDFKLAAIRRYQAGLPPSAIFQEAGFSLASIGRETPKECLLRWRRTFDAKGVAGLQRDGQGLGSRGRPPGLERLNEQERLQYLEAQVAYLKAENTFLAKLRKQRLNYGRTRSSRSSAR
jgi:hypothetical protein